MEMQHLIHGSTRGLVLDTLYYMGVLYIINSDNMSGLICYVNIYS